MSYGQYGSVGYRNGDRIDELSDVMLTPDLRNLGKPGYHPDATTAGMDKVAFAEIEKRCLTAHLVLGEGPVFVTLHKVSGFGIHILENGSFRELSEEELAACGILLPEDVLESREDDDTSPPRINTWAITDFDGYNGVVRFGLLGHVVEIRMMRVRGYALHARLTTPDGTVWSGFSGSEIGYGFDDEDTAPRIEQHKVAFDA